MCAMLSRLTYSRSNLHKQYPEDYEATVRQAERERDAGFLPPLKGTAAGIGSYETIFLGFPIWGMTAPPVIGSFLSRHDLTGKPSCRL